MFALCVRTEKGLGKTYTSHFSPLESYVLYCFGGRRLQYRATGQITPMRMKMRSDAEPAVVGGRGPAPD